MLDKKARDRIPRHPGGSGRWGLGVGVGLCLYPSQRLLAGSEVLARSLLNTGKLKQTNKPIKNKRKHGGKKEIQFCCPGVPLQEPFVPGKDKAVLCSQLLSRHLCTSWVINTNQEDPCVKRFAPTYSTPHLGTGALTRIRVYLEQRQNRQD